VHFFDSDEYLGACCEARHPGRPWRPAYFRVGDAVVRLALVDGRPVTGGDFYDFVTPLEPPDGERLRSVPWLRQVVAGLHEVSGVPTFAPDQWPAPLIEWSRFPTAEAFQDHVLSRRASLARDARTKRRNLEKAFGPVSFRFEDDRPGVFDRCIAWKSAQYRASGSRDLFASPGNLALFRALARRGVLRVSSFSAGERLCAVHLGVEWGNAMHAWVPAYDAETARYSPGRLLFDELMEESRRRGHRIFDFLIGDEPYKWHYATHYRLVAPAGTPALSQRVWRGAKGAARGLLGHHPGLLAGARRLRDRMRERSR